MRCQLYILCEFRQLIWYGYLDLSWSRLCKVCVKFEYNGEKTIARTDHPSCPSLDKQALDRSKFSQSLCTTDHTPWMLIFASTTLLSLCPRSILPHCPECCTVSILQLNWRTNKILVIVQIRGAQTFTINRQGLECQTAINRIQHSYNPNFSKLEPSKVRLTYIHLIM